MNRERRIPLEIEGMGENIVIVRLTTDMIDKSRGEAVQLAARMQTVAFVGVARNLECHMKIYQRRGSIDIGRLDRPFHAGRGRGGDEITNNAIHQYHSMRQSRSASTGRTETAVVEDLHTDIEYIIPQTY